MKILIFGHTGQIGSALASVLQPSHTLITPDIDLTNDTLLTKTIKESAPDVIINAAAHTQVDAAEDHPDVAFQINAAAPSRMAEIAKDHHSLLIHYSTDYVFDGTGKIPWHEDSSPHPLNIYGQSKLAGDIAILKSGCRHLIFRTSWVYGIQNNNFIRKILSLTQTNTEIHVVSDQIGAPTSAEFIARTTALTLSRPTAYGLYNLCSSGETSWFEYACFINKIADKNSHCKILPILSEDYPQPAQRPLNSRLNCQKLMTDFGITPPHWEEGVLSATQKILKDYS